MLNLTFTNGIDLRTSRRIMYAKCLQEDTGSSQYRRRHKYLNNEITIDGVTYKIISVTAWSDCDYKPKKVSELLAYLVNGK